MKQWMTGITALAVVVAPCAPVAAQDAASATPAASSGDEAEGEAVAVDLLTAVPDPASVTMPKLEFTASPEIAATYDKYFYFHRTDTDFPTALADIRECDGFARGLAMPGGYGNTPAPYPYAGTLAGGVGAALGNALAVAIFGSAEKRKLRRANLRRCMNYKGYQRYGLEKELWQSFNFEEGLSSVQEAERQRKLAMQAKVASGPRPIMKELGR